MKKRLLAIILSISMLTSLFCASTVFAEKNVSVIVDGKKISFDVEPRLIGGRTMVPLRAIFEALGATVSWDDKTETVTAYNDAYIVKCTIDSNTMYVNNVPKTIDVAPMMIDSRTLVPARFIAESFNCNVSWDSENFVVSIKSNPINYDNVEKETTVQQTIPQSSTSDTHQNTTPTTSNSARGTRTNPYSANEGATVSLQEWSSDPVRKVSVKCTNIIKGERANSLAYSENRFNDTPTSSQEWIFMEFNVKFISSTDGEDDCLEGSDVIYKDKFFTSSGSAIPVHDTATLGDTYRGYGVFDVKLYPGGSSKIVIGILTDKNVDSIILQIPYKSGTTNYSWIDCLSGSNISSSPSATSKPSYSQSMNENYNSNTSSISYYPGTTLPTYTSITGRKLKTSSTQNKGIIYIYSHDKSEYADYVVKLKNYGWSEYKNKTDYNAGSLTYYMMKGGNLVSVTYQAKYSEVWIGILTD